MVWASHQTMCSMGTAHATQNWHFCASFESPMVCFPLNSICCTEVKMLCEQKCTFFTWQRDGIECGVGQCLLSCSLPWRPHSRFLRVCTQLHNILAKESQILRTLFQDCRNLAAGGLFNLQWGSFKVRYALIQANDTCAKNWSCLKSGWDESRTLVP